MQKVVRLNGTPYEQGLAQGRAVADDIRNNLGQIRTLIDRLVRGRADWYDELVQRNLRFLAQLDPETLEELEGIAEGSAIPLGDIHAMNLPIYTALRRASVSDECSVWAATPEATRDHQTYLVKTRDQPVDQFQFQHIVAYRTYPDGRQITEVNAAGIITNPGSGINDRGLAVGTAGSWSQRHMKIRIDDLDHALCMPDMHYLLRHAGTVAEAHAVLRDTPRMAGMNIIVADAGGNAATVELTADQALLTSAENGTVAITNHYTHPQLIWANDTRAERPTSYVRYDTITRYLADRRPHLSSRDLLRLSMDHEHGPQDSVCRHSPDGTGSTTRFVSLMAVEEFDTWTFCDFPCRMALVVQGGQRDWVGDALSEADSPTSDRQAALR